jgi:drug/metabolite transporter (DMT)-like permease
LNFPFLGELASLGTSLMFSIGPTFFTLSGRLVGSAVVNRTRLLAALVMLAAAHLAIYGSLLPLDASPSGWFWFGLSGVIGLTLGDAALFQAFVQIGPRLTMLVFSLSPVLTAVMGYLWLGERLGSFQLLGMGITLGGVAWVVSERDPGRTGSADSTRGTLRVPQPDRDYRMGLFFAFLGALGQAGGLITAKFGLVGDFPVLSGQIIRMGVASLALWAWTLMARQGSATWARLREQPLALRYILAGAFFGPVLGIFFSLVGIQNTQVGVASTLQALPPVFLIPIGYYFMKERVSARAVAGTLLSLAGVAVLFLV